MIGIRLGTLITLVTLLGVGMVVALWFWFLWQDRRRDVRRRRLVVHCRICGHAYQCQNHGPSPLPCPACGALNERDGMKPI